MSDELYWVVTEREGKEYTLSLDAYGADAHRVALGKGEATNAARILGQALAPQVFHIVPSAP